MSEPYYRPERGHWAARIDGRRRVLVQGPNDRKTKAEAWAILTRIKKEIADGIPARGTVKELVNAYWAAAERQVKIGELADSTIDRRRKVLISFGRRLGRVLVSDLRAHHVEQWLAADHPNWGATTLNTRIGWIKRVFSWGVEVGLCQRSPIAGMNRPQPTTRQDFIEPADWDRLLDACTPAELREIVGFALHSACRVEEIWKLEARYHRAGKFELPIRRSKGKRQSRVIRYPTSLSQLVCRLITAHPDGPVFRASNGEPWNKDSLNCGLRRARQKLGWGVLNGTMLRHSACYARLVAGQNPLMVQKLMGHKSGRMIEQRYGHIESNEDVMRAAADFLMGAAPLPPASSQQASGEQLLG